MSTVSSRPLSKTRRNIYSDLDSDMLSRPMPPATPEAGASRAKKPRRQLMPSFLFGSSLRARARAASIKYGTSASIWPDPDVDRLLLGGLGGQECEQRAQRMVVSTWEHTHNPLQRHKPEKKAKAESKRDNKRESKRSAWSSSPVNVSSRDQSDDEGEDRPIFIEEWMWGRKVKPTRMSTASNDA